MIRREGGPAGDQERKVSRVLLVIRRGKRVLLVIRREKGVLLVIRGGRGPCW